jgi:hypothetical protein
MSLSFFNERIKMKNHLTIAYIICFFTFGLTVVAFNPAYSENPQDQQTIEYRK